MSTCSCVRFLVHAVIKALLEHPALQEAIQLVREALLLYDAQHLPAQQLPAPEEHAQHIGGESYLCVLTCTVIPATL